MSAAAGADCSLAWLPSTGTELICDAVLILYQLLNISRQAVGIFSQQCFIRLPDASFFKSPGDLKDDISEHIKVFSINRYQTFHVQSEVHKIPASI